MFADVMATPEVKKKLSVPKVCVKGCIGVSVWGFMHVRECHCSITHYLFINYLLSLMNTVAT